jgi:hypothetical protein
MLHRRKQREPLSFVVSNGIRFIFPPSAVGTLKVRRIPNGRFLPTAGASANHWRQAMLGQISSIRTAD